MDSPPRPPFRETLACALRWRCPHCRRGTMFRGWLRIREHCPECGLAFFRESGYYVGAMMMNYGVTVVLLIVFYLLLLPLPDVTRISGETKIALWLVFAILLSLALMRHSYSFWLAFDYWLDPWQPEPPARSFTIQL